MKRAILAAVACGLILGGCASVITGYKQTIAVTAEPAGTVCAFTRGGLILATVAAPGSVEVTRADQPFDVSCTKPDYQPVSFPLRPGAEWTSSGNLLFLGGGIVFLAIDNITGASNVYPDKLSVVLQPAVFTDATARAAYFDALRATTLQNLDGFVAAMHRACLAKPDADPYACDQEREAYAAIRASEIGRLNAAEHAAPLKP